MKNILYILVTLFFFSCNNNDKYPKADDALKAGRAFIEGCLKGDFKQSDAYMLQDSINAAYFTQIKADYTSSTASYRKTYRNASINIESIEAVTDSITIINYKNSFDHIARKVKVIYNQDSWLVDFKYTFNGNL